MSFNEENSAEKNFLYEMVTQILEKIKEKGLYNKRRWNSSQLLFCFQHFDQGFAMYYKNETDTVYKEMLDVAFYNL